MRKLEERKGGNLLQSEREDSSGLPEEQKAK